ncbi:MAG: DMT family transporter [Alphaproteobacteria bacterium]|nr:DMT family transporter [Alphaproteobacteria bacterium]
MEMSPRTWLLMMLLGLIWGGTFFLSEILLLEMTPFQIVFHRVSIAAIIMVIYITWRGKRLPRDKRSWFALAIMGLLNNAIPFSAIVFGQQYITGGLAAILNSTTAFFGVILAGLFFKDERLTLRRLIGVIMGIIGVAIIIGMDVLSHLSLTSIGQLLIIVSSISYAFAGIWGRLQVKNLGVDVTATGMLISSSVWMLILATMVEGFPLEALSLRSTAAILTFSVVCTAVAYLLYFAILSAAGAANLTLVTIIIPPFALMLDAFALGEWVTGQQLLGFAIIASGLLVISGKLKFRR